MAPAQSASLSVDVQRDAIVTSADASKPASSDRADDLGSRQRATSAVAKKCIDWLRDYAGKRINSRLIDERRSISPYIVLDFGNQGLLGMRVPKAWGGKLELSMFDTLKLLQQMAAIDMTLAAFVTFNNILGIQPILMFGKPAIRERFLPDLAAGRKLAAFSYTEPCAGSNPLDIQASASQLIGGQYLLNGSKIFIGTAAWAGVISVFANHFSTEGKALGHVAFCLPADLKGIRHEAEALTMGMRGMVQNSVIYDDVRIEPEYVLGQPGGGLAVASDAMLTCRLGIAAMCVGGMRRALQLAGRYACRRVIGSARLIESDLVRSRIASMYAAAQAADSLIDRIACDIDDGIAVPPEAFSAAKAACGEWLWESVDAAMQLLGARGYIETNQLAQMFRDARMARLGEGPTDTMLMHIGKRVLETESPLFEYIAGRLGAADTAAALREQLNFLRQCQSSGEVRTIRYMAAGHLATLHLIRACSRDDACLPWLDARIARSVEIMTQVPPVDRARAAQMLDEIASSIGDIEQTAPDEDRLLDRYLKKEFA